QKLQFEAGDIAAPQRDAPGRRSLATLLAADSGGDKVFAVGQAVKRKPSGAAWAARPTWLDVTRSGDRPCRRIKKHYGDGGRGVGFFTAADHAADDVAPVSAVANLNAVGFAAARDCHFGGGIAR